MIAELMIGVVTSRVFAGEQANEITQPQVRDRAAFMQRAFEMRRIAIGRGDQPYGAVVVKDGRIIGEGISAVVTNSDPTAHAEMQAIRDTIRRFGAGGIKGAELFGTSRACPMCERGAYEAGIALMVYGESATEAGAPRMR
ncbi:MAG: nucleoside deaminase [Burkholderiales bacterium]